MDIWHLNALHGHFSMKSDVYSFGVLILEIIIGQKNSAFQNGENVENLLSFVSQCLASFHFLASL